MLFTTDKQTLDDLNIFGKHGSDSVYQIFNRTSTRGGASILEQMFQYPLSDAGAINRRSGIIQYFAAVGTVFPFSTVLFDAVEPYLQNTDERTKLSAQQHSVSKKLSNLVALDADTAVIYKGIAALTELLKGLNEFLSSMELNAGHFYHSDKSAMVQLLALPEFGFLLRLPVKGKLSATEYAEYDVLLRFRHRDTVKKLLAYIYELDVCLSVAKVAGERGFIFPKALPQNQHIVKLEGVYHPQVKNAVANSINITPDSNVIFLTGANMAGKSTFMKSLSIALFLAHMGFPVAAKKMEFSVLDGIYTTINLPDNLGMGASHFYAEVLRAKKVASELKLGKNLFILFDELFRGTNVKDAGEATIAFTEAFAGIRNSLFVISTHIIEAGEVLKERCDNINFVYLPTLMEGTKPVYTYTLKQGLTADRHGMIIINNEGILELLEQGTKTLEPGGRIKEQGPDVGFIVDKQTLDDLNLLGKYKPNSIFSIFNRVRTDGGERLLQEMFHNPLTDPDEINKRSSLFCYFQESGLEFPFSNEGFRKVEHYLSTGTAGNYPAAFAGVLYKKIQGSFLRDEQFEELQSGLAAAIEVLKALSHFLDELDRNGKLPNAGKGSPYGNEAGKLKAILTDVRLQALLLENAEVRLSFLKIAGYDYLLKHTLQDQMESMLESIYRLDVYLAVSNVARERSFAYAKALPKSSNLIKTTGLWHPALIKGIANPLDFNRNENMIFLTGANMAGKSTFMKSFGIAVYLSHMGFPVAAKEMEFSVSDGLYSSINVPDDLNMGYSHFYAEVLRVKKVAEEVATGKSFIVLFDELFKGTNVKDAYDATLSVTEAFSKYRNCFFIISTHIIEVGEALRQTSANVQFSYLPTVMDGNVPRYTYLLQEGITTDRQGMLIIENEKILEMIKTKDQTTDKPHLQL